MRQNDAKITNRSKKSPENQNKKRVSHFVMFPIFASELSFLRPIQMLALHARLLAAADPIEMLTALEQQAHLSGHGPAFAKAPHAAESALAAAPGAHVMRERAKMKTKSQARQVHRRAT